MVCNANKFEPFCNNLLKTCKHRTVDKLTKKTREELQKLKHDLLCLLTKVCDRSLLKCFVKFGTNAVLCSRGTILCMVKVIFLLLRCSNYYSAWYENTSGKSEVNICFFCVLLTGNESVVNCPDGNKNKRSLPKYCGRDPHHGSF